MKTYNTITGKFFLSSLILFSLFLFSCSKKSTSGTVPPITPPATTGTNDVAFWLTTSDQLSLLKKQSTVLSFGTTSNSNAFIDVDTTQILQTIDGFGYTFTGGGAYVIDQMNTTAKASLLKELFGSDSTSIGVSYLRLSIGASDMDATVFSYDDVAGDTTLSQFNFGVDSIDLIPLLKQIVAINPSIKIIATPWSPPLWMKSNNSSVGGKLLTNYYSIYANYFVKYIQQMKANGITIDAVTPQNEPLNPANNPSLSMSASEETNFIKNSLGPAFQTAGLTTKIIVYDHNCDQPSYPDSVLSDAAANAFVNGSAFHLYAGDISALSQVHTAFPDKQLYFTEQYTATTGNFGGDLDWHLKNVIIGSTRNWSRNALEWNMATNTSFGPNTPGGCTTCKGAITVNGSSVTRNVSYYIVAHASKFVPAGSVRIASNISGSLNNVAFKTPTGQKVLIVENDGITTASFNIRINGKWVSPSLNAGAVGTFIWN